MSITGVAENEIGQFTYNLRYLLVAAFALVIASAYFTFSHYALNQNFPLAKLQALIDGTAYKPFQFRILIPWLVGTLNNVTGVAVIVLYQIIESISVIGLIFSSRYFLRRYFEPPLVDIFAFGVALLLPWHYLLPREIALVVPSDIPAVMFFTLLLALMVRKNWIWYYPVFIIATFNRETTCFVTLIFLFAYWKKLPPKALLAHLGSQLLIWITIKTGLWFLYADNPGALFEIFHAGSSRSHFWSNIEFLTSPKRVLIFLSSFGFLWALILVWGKLIEDQFIKRALLALIPFCLVMLIIGNLNEIRILGEWLPLMFTANLIIVRQLFLDYELRKFGL
jgi:hypothetical protein